MGLFENHDEPTWRNFGILLALAVLFHICLFLFFKALIKVEVYLARNYLKNKFIEEKNCSHFRASIYYDTVNYDFYHGIFAGFFKIRQGYYVFRTKTHKNLWLYFFSAIQIMAFSLYCVSCGLTRITRPIALINFVAGIVSLLDYLFLQYFDCFYMSSFQLMTCKARIWKSISLFSLTASGTGLVTYINLNFLIFYDVYLILVYILLPNVQDPYILRTEEITSVQRYVTIWTLNLVDVVLEVAFAIFSLETLSDGVNFVKDPEGNVNWNLTNALYYMIVTISTVGYGDISPSTYLGRLFMFFVLLSALFYVGNKVSELVDIAMASKEGDGDYYEHALYAHAIYAGRPGLADFIAFLETFYSDKSHINCIIVLLAEKLLWSATEYHNLVKGKYSRRVKFVKGTVLDPHDLERAKIRTAQSIFIDFPNDVELSMATALIRNKYPEVRIFGSFKNADSQELIFHSLFRRDLLYKDTTSLRVFVSSKNNDAKLVSLVETQENVVDNFINQMYYDSMLTAFNIFNPGTFNLMNQFVRTKKEKVEYSQLNAEVISSVHSFHTWKIPEQLVGYQFGRLAQEIFSRYNLYVISTLSTADGQCTSVFDLDMIVPEGTYVLVLGMPHCIAAANQKLSNYDFSDFTKTPIEYQIPLVEERKKCFQPINTPTVPLLELSDHIVISIFHTKSFISLQISLRMFSKLESFYEVRVPVVIVANCFDNDQCEKLASEFQAILIRENPTNRKAMVDAGVRRAKAILIYESDFMDPPDTSRKDNVFSSSSNISLDAESVVTYLNVIKSLTFNPQCNIILRVRNLNVMSHMRSYMPRLRNNRLYGPYMRFRPQKILDDDEIREDMNHLKKTQFVDIRNLEVSPMVASGEVSENIYVSALLAREYHIPGTTSFIRSLIGLTDIGNFKPLVHLVAVPKKMDGYTMIQVFEEYIKHGALCFALYRSGQHLPTDQKSFLPYVYKGCSADIKVSCYDGVYVICRAYHTLCKWLNEVENEQNLN